FDDKSGQTCGSQRSSMFERKSSLLVNFKGVTNIVDIQHSRRENVGLVNLVLKCSRASHGVLLAVWFW
ncbi:hypothetical protein MKW92_007767, partial [Papaver armeniacum]